MVRAGRLDKRPADAVLCAACAEPLAVRQGHPAGLTDREVEVLRLLAQDRTNNEIAEALVVTEKTAGHHVEHIYAKAGLHLRRRGAVCDAAQPGRVGTANKGWGTHPMPRARGRRARADTGSQAQGKRASTQPPAVLASSQAAASSSARRRENRVASTTTSGSPSIRGRSDEAPAAYTHTLQLEQTEAERRFLQARLHELGM